MSLHGDSLNLVMIGFPRVSGDEPPAHAVRAHTQEFSPRERG